MLKKSATYLTEQLEKNIFFSNDEKEIYIYGFQLFISTLISTLSIILISIVFQNIGYSIMFFVCFYIIRLFCGGYHATTYLRCFILTNMIFVSTIILSLLETLLKYSNIVPLFVLLAFCVTFHYAPVENANHPYSLSKHAGFKIITRTLSLTYLITYMLIFFLKKNNPLVEQGAWSYIFVSLMIILELIKKRGVKSNANIQHGNRSNN